MDLYLLCGFFVLGLVALTVRELEQIRQARREGELYKIIRSLENRISAKDLTGFMALEDTDRAREKPSRIDKEAALRLAAEHALDSGYLNDG